jgi:hypothetical protein
LSHQTGWLFDLRWTQLLDAERGQPLAHINRLLQRLALNDAGAKPAGKGIARAVGVVDLIIADSMDRVLLDAGLALDSHNGRIRALRNDCNALALLVFLRQVCQCPGNLLYIRRLQIMAFGVRRCFGLVADDVVPIRCACIKRLLEELRDEWCGQREDQWLVPGRSLLAQLHDRRRAHGKVVAADIVRLCALDQRPDIRLLQMLEIIVIRRAEISAHAPVVARNDDSAPTRRLLGIDTVLHPQTGSLDGITQGGRVLVVAHAAQEDHAVGRQHVLRAARRVLRRPASDQLGVEIVKQVLVDAQVLLFGKYRVVGLQPVLCEQCIVAYCLDV